MTPAEVADLLRYVSSLDSWVKATDAESAQLMVAGWSTLLEEVPLDYAQKVVRQHYGQADARSIQPGDISASWHADEQRRLQRERQVERGELQASSISEAAVQGVLPAGGARVYLAALTEALAAGRDPSTVPRPAGVRVLTTAALTRSRECVWASKLCACEHTECRGGFLDAPVFTFGDNGFRYERVERCPACHDAMLMAEERGLAKKPAGAGRRR